MTKKQKSLTLESSLHEINTLIEAMEQGNLSLEESLSHFERGIKLIKDSQKILQQAEQKVQLLMQNNNSNDESLSIYENPKE